LCSLPPHRYAGESGERFTELFLLFSKREARSKTGFGQGPIIYLKRFEVVGLKRLSGYGRRHEDRTDS
jgi:hypothetical protein